VLRRIGGVVSLVLVVSSVALPSVSAMPADAAGSPPALHFGSREVGDETFQRLLFRNMSEEQVFVYALSIGPGFSIESLTCFDGPLAPSERCEVFVGFLPTQIGHWSSTLRIQYCFSTDPLCPGAIFGQERSLDVPLIGTGR
jgi:hypothetical protein